ncbi:MAG: flagellar basal body-associated FliL family protein [Alphaproteobacteria bacterium]
MAKAPAGKQTPASAAKPGAPSSKDKNAEVVEVKSSGGISVLGLIILTLLAVGAGGGFGMFIAEQPQKKAPVQKVDDKQKPKLSQLHMFSLELPPITTTLGGGARIWIRLECTLLTPVEMAEEASKLIGEISEDIIAYLRTVTPEQLNGPGGFQHLREDLNDRVHIRTKNKSTSIIIRALIVE